MLYFSLQVPVKIRVTGESAWSHGPCIVGKMNMLASDTVCYYRHIFTVVGSLIVIAVVTFYGNILCIFCTISCFKKGSQSLYEDNMKIYVIEVQLMRPCQI
jgi:hypothetical protein